MFSRASQSRMTYKVQRQGTLPAVKARWDAVPWNGIPPLTISEYMGDKPDHFPRVQVKVAYDDAAVSVIFKVEDRYVRAVAKHYQDRVYEDSCVEFFFTPADNVSRGYFNLEMNCCGVGLFHFKSGGGGQAVHVAENDFREIQIAHTMHQDLLSEIQNPVTWGLEYRVPLGILAKYCEVTVPAPERIWRANFYKCGDKTSHPHWLSWSAVDHPTPQFHLPEYFGVLEFA